MAFAIRVLPAEFGIKYPMASHKKSINLKAI